MSRVIFKFMALGTLLISLSGCPLVNPFLAEPESAFEGSPSTGDAPLTVIFADTSEAGTANITDWQWDFGDGSTSTLRNPSHIYEMPGRYSVSLTVTTSVGTHTALRQEYINVVQAPTAEFSAMPVIGNAPLTATFSDMSDPGSSEITGWEWNFGDRTPTSAVQNPVHIYSRAGLYTVSLTVTTEVGSDTMEKLAYINVAGTPIANFETDFEPGTAPLTVSFTDTSDAGTAEITGWTWDFGDGGMSMDQNPTYTYETPGLYTVTLSIESEVGSDMIVRANLIRVEEGPVAKFSGNPVMGSAPLSVVFADESSAGSSAISNWLWDFGDGGLLSTRQHPTRVYNVPGVYTVSLKVTSPVGSNTSEQPDYITVLPGVAFTGNRTSGTGSLTVQFIDQSPTGDFDISAWAWDFGDGGMSTERNPEHTYGEAGVYDVSLTITTALGDSTATEAAYVSVSPTTAFSAAPVSGPPPLEVTFTDETAAGTFEISAWAWNFGDGTTSAEQSPVHSYEKPGIYSVALETTTANGKTSAQKSGLVRVSPVVSFGTSGTTGQGTLAVNFEDQTDAGNLSVLSRFWDFGDGSTSTQPNPSHTYQNIGTYSVTLRITTALGDTVKTETDLIKVGPKVDFSSDVKQGVGMLTVKFTDLSDAGTLAITGWMWDFGDGGSSDEQNPVYTYATPGQYSVGLTVTTSQGDTATTKADLILVAPLVDIDFVQASGPAPFEASLLDLTMPGDFEITAWKWNLGDGSTSAEQNPVHTYVEPGKYTVTLEITTAGGTFFVTEKDFITALRGPTALFSFTSNVPTDEAVPVAVSFQNMSLPGDSPILNQTWDFGASATFAEEDAEEVSPSITYPGVAYRTIPQDVSLTVRTFIAADTLLKENLFSASGTKQNLTPDALASTALSHLAMSANGDIWVAGSLIAREDGATDLVVARLSPEGNQRWGLSLASETPVALAGLCVAEDESVIVVGTLETAAQSALYLGCFDAAGAQRWDRIVYNSDRLYGAGIATDGAGGFVATCHGDVTQGEADLYLLSGDVAGEAVSLRETGSRIPRGDVPLVHGEDASFLVSDGVGGVLRAELGDVSATMTPHPTVAPGKTVVLSWDETSNSLSRSTASDGTLWLEGGDGAYAAPDGLSETTPHGFHRDRATGALDVVWMLRDEKAGVWTVQRSEIAP